MKQKKSSEKKARTTESTATVETKQASPEVIRNIDLSMIGCSPFNPRKYRSEEELEELTRSSIEDLVKQFEKTDKYIRSRLQLRNLIDETSELLVREEITLAAALELARFCPDIQKDVYENHLSSDDSYSWKRLQTKDFRRMLESKYSTDLSKYEFDQSDCKGCRFNSFVYDLFADGGCGNCQNVECLRHKQAEYIASEATRLLNEKRNANVGICVAPNSFASAEVVNNLIDTGCEIYEMSANRLPSEPEKPVAENYASETEYVEAEAAYESRLLQYRAHSAQIETMVEQGKAQLLVDVSRRKPELCYRVIPETENRQPVAEDTLEKLRRQDERNREIAVEKGIEEVKRHVKENAVPDKDFSPREQQLLYFILFAFLRKDNHGKFGIKDGQAISEEEKLNLMTSLSGEQENALRRDFIIYALSQTSGDGLKSQLLLEFATLHFPDRVAKIKQQCNEVYRKKHERIEARIRELQPFTGKQEDAKTAIAEAIVVDDEQPTDPETFDEPDTEDIPLYPGLPEYATVGDIPEEEEQMFDTVYEDMAA